MQLGKSAILICALGLTANAERDLQTAAPEKKEIVSVAPTDYPMFDCDFWLGMSYYNLESIQKGGENYKQDNAQWNFCTYAGNDKGQYDVKDTFAFLTRAGSSWTLPMTGYTSNYDSFSSADNGIQFIQESNTKCAVSNENTSFKTTIQCDWSIRGQGQAKIISVDNNSSPCQLQVVMAHRAGCPATPNAGFKDMSEHWPITMGWIISWLGWFVMPCLLILQCFAVMFGCN